ncbi:hypothetical protein KSP40_PGU005697 [Platanthera guangdongensis]|uniref:Uncharacterized protein n=1 Tax=Platanthera guangdongensis TaxID=2320717 RepID=A0ABR2LI85_9ASPA
MKGGGSSRRVEPAVSNWRGGGGDRNGASGEGVPPCCGSRRGKRCRRFIWFAALRWRLLQMSVPSFLDNEFWIYNPRQDCQVTFIVFAQNADGLLEEDQDERWHTYSRRASFLLEAKTLTVTRFAADSPEAREDLSRSRGRVAGGGNREESLPICWRKKRRRRCREGGYNQETSFKNAKRNLIPRYSLSRHLFTGLCQHHAVSSRGCPPETAFPILHRIPHPPSNRKSEAQSEKKSGANLLTPHPLRPATTSLNNLHLLPASTLTGTYLLTPSAPDFAC